MKNTNDRAGIVSLSNTEIEMYGEQIAGGSIALGNFILASVSSLIAVATYLKTYGRKTSLGAYFDIVGRYLNLTTKGYSVSILTRLRDSYPAGSDLYKGMDTAINKLNQGWGLKESMDYGYAEIV